MSAVLELRQVTKRFASHRAVADVSLEVPRGAFFSLLGPSGCGKTTTLRMIAGFETPDTGEIWLNGSRIDALPPYRRNVNTVFQSYALFPHLTVRGNVEFGLQRKKANGIEARVRARAGTGAAGGQGIAHAGAALRRRAATRCSGAIAGARARRAAAG